MITKVTLTGTDDSVYPEELIEFSKQYPFVEWGILMSMSDHGKERFPSKAWLHNLCAAVNESDVKPNLSLHLCGQWVRNALRGDWGVKHLLDTYPIFQRVQLNTHALSHIHNPHFAAFLPKDREYIFQWDGVNVAPLYVAKNAGLNVAALFDISHGAGVLPSEWPQPLEGIKCGYAGGLSPQNLPAQIRLIEEAAGGAEIWIDMETHVRSLDDAVFDMYKVRKCLEASITYGGVPDTINT